MSFFKFNFWTAFRLPLTGVVLLQDQSSWVVHVPDSGRARSHASKKTETISTKKYSQNALAFVASLAETAYSFHKVFLDNDRMTKLQRPQYLQKVL